jgi:CheY-like chemotaxis protein
MNTPHEQLEDIEVALLLDGMYRYWGVDFEAVLMDIMMPGMDGYEAIGEIRKMKRFENLPVIALTAKAMKADRDRCIEAGASDYISKPLDIDQLLSLLRVWLYQQDDAGVEGR